MRIKQAQTKADIKEVRKLFREYEAFLNVDLCFQSFKVELGYSLMRLDTLDRLTEAMHLYEALGFRRTLPYYDNPLPGVVYWELTLNEERNGKKGATMNADRPRSRV